MDLPIDYYSYQDITILDLGQSGWQDTQIQTKVEQSQELNESLRQCYKVDADMMR